MIWSSEKHTYIKAISSSKKSNCLSSSSKNVGKTYQNMVKTYEPHVKKEFVNDCFLAGKDNGKTRKSKNARLIQEIFQILE